MSNRISMTVERTEMARFTPRTGSASRSYWLYVWRESKYRPGTPNDSSEQPQIFQAICDEEAAEIAAERGADAIIWELYDGSGWSDKSNHIASKKRGLVTPNAASERQPT